MANETKTAGKSAKELIKVILAKWDKHINEVPLKDITTDYNLVKEVMDAQTLKRNLLYKHCTLMTKHAKEILDTKDAQEFIADMKAIKNILRNKVAGEIVSTNSENKESREIVKDGKAPEGGKITVKKISASKIAKAKKQADKEATINAAMEVATEKDEDISEEERTPANKSI